MFALQARSQVPGPWDQCVLISLPHIYTRHLDKLPRSNIYKPLKCKLPKPTNPKSKPHKLHKANSKPTKPKPPTRKSAANTKLPLRRPLPM